jgi:AcrR family transcriptional regulator
VRRAVLDAAIEIITTDGPDQVSMREVARRAGVSHQAPYHHFTDRAGIFAAISEEGFRAFTAEFRAAFEGSADPVADCLRTYVRFALTHKGHFKVMFRSDICGLTTHEATRAAADGAYLALLDLAAAAGNAPGGPDAVVLPVLLWSLTHGLATLLVDGPLVGKLPPDLTVEDLVNAVATAAAASFPTHQHLRQP